MKTDISLRHGNCMAVLRGFADGSFPLIIADPPYGIGYHSNHYKDKNPHAPVANDWNFQIGLFLQECARVLCDGGALYLFCRWDVQPLWIPHVTGTGLKLKTVISWVKDNWSAGDLDGCFGNQYEQILFITKGRHLLRGRRWSNVWEFPRVPPKKMIHPTQKPVPLLERAILASSDEGQTVLDPFAGSGSTGAACQGVNRNSVLIDIDARMVNIAARRLGLDPPCEDDQKAEPTPEVTIDPPSWEEWGIHPEDVRALMGTLRQNVNSVMRQGSLFDRPEDGLNP